MSSTKTTKPVTKVHRINFILSPAEKRDMDGLPKRIGIDTGPLVRVALRLFDERREPIEKIQAEQSRTVLTNIRFADEDAALLEKLAKRNKCTKSDVIRYALRALRDRGLRFG